jgi:SAM-dependent methyltransferase
LRRGFGIASGEVFGYLNADDLLEPGALRRVGEHFAKHRGSNVIYFEDIVDVEGWRFPNVAQPKDVDFERLVDGHVLFQDGVFFRRNVYHRAGGMNPDMRLAGDAELWAKLARLTKFERMRGHVSTFRVRTGQLSGQMDRYNAERIAAMTAIRRSLSLAEKVALRLRQWLRLLRRSRSPRHDEDRLFFPIDFAQMPPPAGEVPPAPTHDIPCPFTGARPDRLLFSSRDTRFGNALINYIYYVPETHLTTTYPPLDEAALGRLYETHYSDDHPPMVIPSGTSPYRGYAAKGTLARYALSHQVPEWLAKYAAVNWVDQSFEEMTRVLRDVGVPLEERLSFLDVGCFDGKLLDRVRAETEWDVLGAEPNPRAAAEAKRKGHDVLVAGVDEIVSRIPLESTFDVIWMGQAIEHFNDPLAAIMGLRTLLKPNGTLVLSTPNLDSAQIDMFGPTWAQWHPPYHRYIFSVKSLRAMAERTRMTMLASRTFSHPYWSALNVWQNEHGLGAVLPHGVDLPQEVVTRATQVAAWSKLLFDWRGRGDYIVSAFGKRL